MNVPVKLKLTIYLLGFAGASLFTILLTRQGATSVGAAVAAAGWGIAGVAAFHVVPLFLDASSWWTLFPAADRPRRRSLLWIRWIGEAVSNLIPSAAVGGEIVRARLAAIHGAPMAISAASVIVDLTLGVMTQVIFALIGLGLLVARTGLTSFVEPTLIGALIGAAALAGFYLAQRFGMFRFIGLIIARLVKSPEWRPLVESGRTLDQTIGALYGRRRAILICWVLTLLSMVASSGEIWIALSALGLRANLIDAMILQSMSMTVRSVAFPVPGALGLQEGAYLLIGRALGIPGEAAFAISLITRVRDLTVGIPALLLWQIVEGRRFWQTRSPIATG
jgi:putative membrane protein